MHIRRVREKDIMNKAMKDIMNKGMKDIVNKGMKEEASKKKLPTYENPQSSNRSESNHNKANK